MTDDDALGADMHPLLGSLEPTPPVADQDLLERLLDGQLDPAAAPAGYGGLARLLAAASAPATPEELAGEEQARAEFAAVMPSHPPTLVPRRASMPSKLFTIKAAAAALIAVLSIGGVAVATTGLLPGHGRDVAAQAPSTTNASAAGHGLGRAAAVDLGRATVTAESADAHGQGQGSAVGPDATAAARAGLCRAWQAGKGADNGRRTDSPTFQALAAAAGGADKVAAYCADVTAGAAGAQEQGQGSPPSGSPPSTTVSPPSSGPPPDAGSGGHDGQGGPPTTTG
jgi:hypothetical protein